MLAVHCCIRQCTATITPIASVASVYRTLCTPSSSGKPHAGHLMNIQERVIDSTKEFFDQRVDYTIYRQDVAVDDQIFGLRKQGLPQLMKHFGSIAMFGKAVLPYVELEPMQCHPSLEDGTVRLRWRFKYISYPRMLSDWRFLRKEYRRKNLSWYDGYSIFTVDGTGLVYKLTIQKTLRDESGKVVDPKESLKEKLSVFLPPRPQGAPGAVNCTPIEKRKTDREEN